MQETLTWSDVLNSLQYCGKGFGEDVERWPRFERFEVLPWGIPMPKYFVWDAAQLGFEGEDYHHIPTPEGQVGAVPGWPVEVVGWWRTADLEGHLSEIRAGRTVWPAPMSERFDRDHITEGAKETCRTLWDLRGSWEMAAAVWTLAWCRDACGRRGQEGYGFTVEGRDYLGAVDTAAFRVLGDRAPDWMHQHRRVCGVSEYFDPVTHEKRTLRGKYDVLRALVNDVVRVQRGDWGRLVHLVPDPAFSPDEFLAEEARKHAAIQAKRDAEETAWKARMAEQEAQERRKTDAWKEECARRAQRLEQSAGVAKAEAAALGVSMGCLQNWVRKGLSSEQIQWLSTRPRTHRGKSLDAQLIAAGLVPGLAEGDEDVLRGMR